MNTSTDDPEDKAKATPVMLDSVKEQNWLNLFRVTRPFQFGSLWWVAEDIWKTFWLGYDQQSDRNNHPGLCVQELKSFTSLSVSVMMLHGASKAAGRHFVVYGASPDRAAPTRFKHLCPLPLGYFTSRALIHRNTHKPALSEREKATLRRFLDQTGIMS